MSDTITLSTSERIIASYLDAPPPEASAAPMPTKPPTPAAAAAKPTPFWRLAWGRGTLELKLFARERTSVIFTLMLPVVLLLLLGSILNRQPGSHGVSTGQLLTAGMIGSVVGATCFVNLGISIVVDREDGTLKRLRRTPMPPAVYFIGKIILVLLTSLMGIALVLAVGVAAFDLSLPTDPGRWFTFSWVYLLGITALALLGIAISNVPRSARGAPPVINLPYLILEFISGVFIVPITTLPEPLQRVAAIFPLKWLTQGFRSVFLPESVAALEPAGNWALRT